MKFKTGILLGFGILFVVFAGVLTFVPGFQNQLSSYNVVVSCGLPCETTAAPLTTSFCGLLCITTQTTVTTTVTPASTIYSPISCSLLANPDSGYAPLTVYFSDSVSGGSGVFNYLMVYDDGQSAVVSGSFAHTYSSAGVYAAALYVTDSTGESCSSSQTIVVEGIASATTLSSPTTVSATATNTVVVGQSTTATTTVTIGQSSTVIMTNSLGSPTTISGPTTITKTVTGVDCGQGCQITQAILQYLNWLIAVLGVALLVSAGVVERS